ncbi:MAG: hypothetical protein K8F91_06400 [Candidatus Obscuribacterales bacterium]|nr:hypothetical protein [Candidatus Obscuribacterales bacterium]
MNAFKTLGDYKRILERTRIALTKQRSLPAPLKDSADLASYQSLVEKGRKLLPARYHRDYLDVLDFACDQAKQALAKSPSKRQLVMKQLQSVFSALAAPIMQLDDSSWSARLRAYQAVISNFYRRFLDDRQIRYQMTHVSGWPELDPLGFFLDSDASPFTLAPSRDLPVAFVAKPANHACFAPLFFVDAHEVGGHVFHSAVPGLVEELTNRVVLRVKEHSAGIEKHWSVKTVRVPRLPGLIFRRNYRLVKTPTFVSHVWEKWTAELLCDLSGMLNLGPSYANSLIVFLTAIESSLVIKSSSQFDLDKGISDHPPAIVRAKFCLEILKRLDLADGKSYLSALQKRLELACNGRIPEYLYWHSVDGTGAFSFKAAELLACLPEVVDTMFDTASKSLGDRSFVQIMTWGTNDEAVSRQLASQLLEKNFDADDADESIEARHVIAASILALEEASKKPDFDAMSDRIHRAAVEFLSVLYQQQCLLCEAPVFNNTRRHDFRSLKELSARVERLFG